MPCLGSQKICLSREIIFILHATDQAQPLIYFSTGDFFFFFFFSNFNSFCLEGNKHVMNSVVNLERNQNINYAYWTLNPSMLVPGSPLWIHLPIIWTERLYLTGSQ